MMRATRIIRTDTTTVTLEFNREDLLKALQLPPEAIISVQIPGGGDWSNTELFIGEDVMLDAKWETTATVELD